MSTAIYLSLGAPHLEYPRVEQTLRAHGIDTRLVHLNDIDNVDLDQVDVVNLRMCRWYHKQPLFQQAVERVHARLAAAPGGPIPLANNIDLVRDALDKGRYLHHLADDGVELIPTHWIDKGTPLRLAALMEATGWDELVLKPTVSSGSWNTIRISRQGSSSSDSHFILGKDAGTCEAMLTRLLQTHALCAQQFLPSVLDWGELSMVYLGGRFSHAVRKTVGDAGGWWAHERLGGQNYPWQAAPDQIAWADAIYRALERRYGWLWFARIDGIHDTQGRLRLLECELAIPRLLLPEGDAFDRYAEAIADGIARLSPQRATQAAPSPV
jgi:hypothetical protein